MAYWKCSIDFFHSPIMRAISKPTHTKDGFMPARESIFIKLLSWCAQDTIFYDAKHFSSMTNSAIKQCELIWGICLAHNVLREKDNGYSTKQWMIETGLLGDAPKEAPTSPCAAPPAEAPSYTSEDPETQQDATSCEGEAVLPPSTEERPQVPPAASEPPTIQPEQPKQKSLRWNELKEAVRPNVFLTRSELDNLRSRYSDEQVCLILDKLSDYKLQTHRNYSNDFQAIEKWVLRWLDEQTPSRALSPEEQGIFPSWLTGK
jgi:hypothetical protein